MLVFTVLRRRFSSSIGYTIVELLVVLAIIGLLVGGSIAGYNKFNERQVATQAAKGVISALRQAQSRASSGEKDDTTCTGLIGYRFIVDVGDANGTGLNKYYIGPVCVSGSQYLKEYSLPTGVKFASVQDVTFDGQTGAISTGSYAPWMIIRYSSTQYKISFSEAGTINDEGIQ